MKRLLMILMVLIIIPLGVLGEDAEEENDWRESWKEEGYFDFCDVQDDTLIVFEGITALGEADTGYWDSEHDMYVELEPKFENGPRFERSDGSDFQMVSLPSTLHFLGDESFVFYHFKEFTLPVQLEVLENDAFVYCDFDVLRIETTLPADDILDSLYDCNIAAYDAPDEHPLYKSIDGVLLSKDGKTLISYPNSKKETHYDVPAGVEFIASGAIHNEYLKTVSLPIGLKSIGDYAFSGCTRLQSIVLPLTVSEIGKDVFYCCVSLELVSLPEGIEADKDINSNWVKYYPDDAIFRGDNGDTLSGTRSEGIIDAPGILISRQETQTYSAAGRRVSGHIYDSAESTASNRFYFDGQIVYMRLYQNGRISLYEPLGGTYTGSDGYGTILGWVDIADVQYLHPESLFTYADVKPRSTMFVWWNHLPNYSYWIPWETTIPMEGREYKSTLYGPYVRFDDSESHAVFACAIQDADLTRVSDGTDNVYGIVYNVDFMSNIPLLKELGGELLKEMIGGTQIQILDDKDNWYQVSDGQDRGWVAKEYVKIIQEKQEDK